MKTTIILFISIIFLISCEQDVEFDLPYKEQVVINSLLIKDARLAINPNYIYSFVHIGKTIPPLEKADTNNALVKDAKVRIINNDIVYNLTYAEMGYWLSNGFNPQEGENYRIEVDYKGKTTSAETYIPIHNVEKVGYEVKKKILNDWDGNKFFQFSYFIKVKVNTTEFAFLKSVSFGPIEIKTKYYDEVLYSNSKYGNEFSVFINTIEMSDLKDTTFYKNNKFLYEIDSFDPAFERYWDTQDLGNEESGIFGGGGLNIEGNIKNGIGFFYGSNPKIDSLNVSFN